MPSRYKNRQIVRNTSELYETFMEDRDVGSIRHDRTPHLKHPTGAQRRRLEHTKVVWKQGDRFWKLAAKHYGSPKYWWVIAWYNQKPTESSVNLGTVIMIPKPLERVLEIAGY